MIIYLINFFVFLINSIFIEKYLHIYQLKDYQNIRYFKFFKYKFWFGLLALFVLIIDIAVSNNLLNIILTCCLTLISIIFNLNLIKQNKTPINYTPKLKRVYAICVIAIFVCCLFEFGGIISLILLIFLPPFANFINIYDKVKNKKYIVAAQNKLQNSKAKIIAITGSNGKTSVKNILFKMLKTKYNVLVSPKSYNTLLGISKFINESNLNVDFAILEYGARRVGDVKKLCSTFGADYGIITTVSPQHLESFKTVENIYKTKKELSDFLLNNLCVYNLDNIYTFRMFCEKPGEKQAISVATKQNFYADNIVIKDYKTHFNLHINDKTYDVCTPLLGQHNITNILLAGSLAVYLKIDESCLVETIKNLNFVPHRLELIKTHINILDDSYNCSLSSAKEALKVFKQFPNKKMVVTPGIIEGGKFEFDLNFKLAQMLNMCDYIVIVGEHNKKALTAGLNVKNKTKVFYAKNLEDAKQYFKLLKRNDNLLLLNDLPDDYS